MHSCTDNSTRNSTRRRTCSASRQRLNGYGRLSSPAAAPVSIDMPRSIAHHRRMVKVVNRNVEYSLKVVNKSAGRPLGNPPPLLDSTVASPCGDISDAKCFGTGKLNPKSGEHKTPEQNHRSTIPPWVQLP